MLLPLSAGSRLGRRGAGRTDWGSKARDCRGHPATCKGGRRAGAGLTVELAAAGAPRTAGHHGCRPVTRRGHDMCSGNAASWQQAGEGRKGCCRAAAGWRQAAGLLGSRCRLRGAAGLLRGRCRPEMGCTATAGLWARGRADCKPAGPETSCRTDYRSVGPRAALPG